MFTTNQPSSLSNLQSTDREKIEVFFSCRKLKNKDVFSKSDPKLSFFQKNSNNQWVKIGDTETIQNNLNPDFSKSFQVDFIFERRQEFKISVVDVDDASGKSFDPLGSTTFEMGQLIGSSNNTLILQLIENGVNQGSVIVRSEKVANLNNDILNMQFSLANVPKPGLCSSGKFFLEIYKPRITEDLKQALTNDPNILRPSAKM
jgi:hypothetical protein